MPDLPAKVRRAALEALGRDTLAKLTEKLDLAVQDRRAAAAHVEALLRSRTVEFADLLGELQRDELKAICEVLGLDQSGREKDLLVQRILAGPAAAPVESTASGATASVVEPPPPGAKLTIDQLEAYLWGAADKLRGKIDSSDYKSFIFGFLFLKRLSDVFEEEAEKLIGAGNAPEVAWEDRDYHRFYVPKRARWSSIQKQATGIGDYLNKACAALEEENTSLEGVLRGIDYNDENKLGHAKERDELLARLVIHFSKISLRNVDLAEPDMLGRAYEYLIEKFADDAGKKGGEFYTPRKVVQLIVELLQPKETDRICDPTIGSGGMLIECAKYVERHGGDPRKLTLHGQENNLGTWAICKMNMLLHGMSDARIEKGDTIRNPRLVKDGALEVYDIVIANPPFSLDDWGRETAEADPFGRFRFGLPPKGKADLAFVQHMVATMGIHGRLGVVMPHGVLFRVGAEGQIRTGLLKEDLVEAVVGLPPNLFYGTGMPAVILILAKQKEAGRRRSVLFIDASAGFHEGPAQNRLRDCDITKMADTFHGWEQHEHYSRVVSIEEIEKNEWTLTVTRYVEPPSAKDAMEVGHAIRVLDAARERRTAAHAALNDILTAAVEAARGDHPNAEPWISKPIGTLADLANGRAFKPSDWKTEGLPIIRIQNLNGSQEFNYFDGEVEARYRVEPGDLLFSWSGSRGTSFGPHIWRGPPGVLNQHIFNVRNLRGVTKEYLYYALRLITAEIEQRAHGGVGLVHVTKGELERFEVPVPSTHEQEWIANALTVSEAAIGASSAELDGLRSAQEAIMATLLTGKIRPGVHRG